MVANRNSKKPRIGASDATKAARAKQHTRQENKMSTFKHARNILLLRDRNLLTKTEFRRMVKVGRLVDHSKREYEVTVFDEEGNPESAHKETRTEYVPVYDYRISQWAAFKKVA